MSIPPLGNNRGYDGKSEEIDSNRLLNEIESDFDDDFDNDFDDDGLDERVSECAEDVIDRLEEGTPRTEGYMAEYDLSGRVERPSEERRGVFSRLLLRIRSAARRVRSAFTNYFLGGRSHQVRKGQEAAQRVDNQVQDDKAKKEGRLANYNKQMQAHLERSFPQINLGVNRKSEEALIITGKLLESALKKADEVKIAFLGIPLDEQTRANLYDSLDSTSKRLMDRLVETLGGLEHGHIINPEASIPTLRAVLKLCAVPSFQLGFKAVDLVESLAVSDPKRPYDNEKQIAGLLQEFIMRGGDAAILAQDLLFSWRQQLSAEIAVLLGNLEQSKELDYEKIQNSLEENMPKLAASYYHKDDDFDKQMNYLVKVFFGGWKRLDERLFVEHQ